MTDADLVLEQLTGSSVDEVLEVLRSYTDMDVAFVGEFSTGRRIVRYVSGRGPVTALLTGRSDDVVDSYCRLIAERVVPPVIPDVRQHPELASLAITSELGIGRYVGVPIHLSGGEVYGTLCCFGHEAVAEVPREVTSVLSVAAALVARRLEAPEHRFVDVVATQDRIRAVLTHESALAIVFQPIVELGSGRVVGYEALARFPGTDAGTPDAWFADAHRVGLGHELELAAASRALAALAHLPPDTYLAVNLSAPLLEDDAAMDVLLATDPTRTVVELTEQQLGSGLGLVAARQALRAHGVRLAVDDLGSGFAGLSRLLELAPDIIKFDRFLTIGVAVDQRRSALARATVSFAAATGATLVAEGVETREDLGMLTGIGVPCAQGYLLGRPAPLDLA